tara:strand:+ start:51 stop:167 length:117 start_codon:yes stop_codon:yes gene_type:complete
MCAYASPQAGKFELGDEAELAAAAKVTLALTLALALAP